MEQELGSQDFRVVVNADSTFTITIGSPSLTGTAEDVRAIIHALATTLASQPESVPFDPPWADPRQLHHRVQAAHDPRFWIQRTALQDGVILSLRHPSLGWLAFQIPAQHVQTMISLLQQQIDAPQSSGRA